MKTILDMVDSKTTSLGESVGKNKAEFYLDENRFQEERRILFREAPLFAGLSSELPEPGDTRAEMIDGVPVLFVRNKQGELKAFLNACRHRGAKLARDACAQNKSRLICPYHAWSYDLDGKLLAVSYASSFGEINPEELSLIQLPCAEKYGMIYVALTPGVEIDIDSLLQGHLEEMKNWDFGNTTFVSRTEIAKDTNWKLALDTYCENYHLATAHPSTLGVTKINNCGHTWRFGYKDRSHAITFPDKTVMEYRGTDPETWDQPLDHFSIIYYLFPNTIFSVFPHMLLFWRILPGARVGESITLGTAFARGQNPSAEDIEKASAGLKRVAGLIIDEDYPLGRDAMEAYESGLLPFAIFGRNEPELFAMHEAIDEALQERKAEA